MTHVTENVATYAGCIAAEIHTINLPDEHRGNFRLSVTSVGDGPLVVLLHGVPDIGYTWRHQLSALSSAGFRLAAPDQRGCGWSDCPEDPEAYRMERLVGDVIALMDLEEAPSAAIIGHGWGAVVASECRRRHPDRVDGLILVAPPDVAIASGPLDHVGVAVDNLDADPIGTAQRLFWTASADRPEDWNVGDEIGRGRPDFLGPGEFENYCRAYARTGFGPGLEWRPGVVGCALHAELVIVGERDTLSASVADVETLVVANAGHFVHQEAPRFVNEALCDVLAGRR